MQGRNLVWSIEARVQRGCLYSLAQFSADDGKDPLLVELAPRHVSGPPDDGSVARCGER